ncbi:MAG: hypothetical protein LN590_07800 [Rickettsia endosymbiont of Glossina mortisans submortisans]|nr:hypothetical protein [Rickettsia endosymbiont of Glossina mortisans submortisans]
MPFNQPIGSQPIVVESLLDVSVELHQESSLIQVDINDHVTEIPLMGDQS